MDRVDPPYAADEHTMLVAFLDYYRETMIRKLSIVLHLAYVELWWFRTCFAGEPDEPIPGGDEDPDIDFRVPGDRTIADVPRRLIDGSVGD